MLLMLLECPALFAFPTSASSYQTCISHIRLLGSTYSLTSSFHVPLLSLSLTNLVRIEECSRFGVWEQPPLSAGHPSLDPLGWQRVLVDFQKPLRPCNNMWTQLDLPWSQQSRNRRHTSRVWKMWISGRCKEGGSGSGTRV